MLTASDTDQIRTIVREEIREEICGTHKKIDGLDEQVQSLTRSQQSMRQDIDELKGSTNSLLKGQQIMRQDIDELKGSTNSLLKDQQSMRHDIDELKSLTNSLLKGQQIMRQDIDEFKHETYRTAVIQEDMHSDLKAALELLSDGLGVRPVVQNHDTRLQLLETNQTNLTKTVSLHSRQLKRR